MRTELTEPPDPEPAGVPHGAGAAEAPKTLIEAMRAVVNCILMGWKVEVGIRF